VTTVIVASQQLVEIILNVASSVDTRLLRDHEQATGFDPKPVVRCDRPRWQAMPHSGHCFMSPTRFRAGVELSFTSFASISDLRTFG
jgi:hypothetical protein